MQPCTDQAGVGNAGSPAASAGKLLLRHVGTFRSETVGLDDRPTGASKHFLLPFLSQKEAIPLLFLPYIPYIFPTKASQNIDIASRYPENLPVADMKFLPDCLATDRNS